MARSRWKFSYFSKFVWRLMFFYTSAIKTNTHSAKRFQIYTRSSCVPKCLMNSIAYIHTGRGFLENKLIPQQLKTKFGEYAFTRKIFYYPMRKKIKPRK